jgi:excisionase family DNA binding protein
MSKILEVETIEPAALSVKSTCGYLSLGRRGVYDLIAAKVLRAKKSGTRTLVDYQSAKAYYASLPEAVIGASIPNAPQSIAPRRRRTALPRAKAVRQ